MGLDVDLVEFMRRALDSRVSDVFTGIPARVKAYHPGADPTADLIPVVRKTIPTDDESDTTEDLPVVPNVPILFPRGGGGAYAITWPLAPGDHVWILVSVFSFSQWRNTGQVSDAGDQRLHSLGNCYAIPGVSPKSEDLSQSSITALVLEGPEIRLGKDATDPVALAPLVDDRFQTLVTKIDAMATLLGVPTLVSVGSTAANKTKAE